MAVFNYLRSTILSKVVMAATGIILMLFIVGHLAGNLQVFLGKDTFNHYAQMLQSLGEFLWIIRSVLLVSLLLHIITSVYLNAVNNAAKPIKYQVKSYVKAKVNSRTMIWTGIMIAAFLTYHLLHLTAGVTNPDHYANHVFYPTKSYYSEEGKNAEQLNSLSAEAESLAPIVNERHDVYKMVVLGFREPLISIAYVIGVVLLGFHLSHAIQSAFQTLGVTGPKFTPALVKVSVGLSIIITILYASIPLSILTGLVGGGI